MPHASPKRHGDLKYILVEEDVFVETSRLKDAFRLDTSSGLLVDPAKPLPPVFAGIRLERLFRFGRMFRRPNLPEFRPDPNDLIDLGLAMKEEVDAGVNRNLPAGYTLLGQFIDHDITFDASEDLSYGAVEPENQPTKRSPSLDLDSLYGLPPLKDVMRTDIGRHVYQVNQTNLAVGQTIRDGAVSPAAETSFPNDLPRALDVCLPPSFGMTIDPRNDENTAIAQMHLAFIKFHNAVVKRFLRKGVRSPELLDKAREFVVQHYQWIVLEDYLRKIIDGDILNDVMDNGCQHFRLREKEDPFMPVEFSVAAFRLGHALVTETYEWNRYFQSSTGRTPARLPQLFTFTGFHENNFLNLGRLPSSWVIDWTRFFDFSDLGINPTHTRSYARTISPFIVRSLAELPFFPNKDKSQRSLAVRNLLRGRLLGLPTGQSVADRLGVTSLKPDEIAVGSHREILRICGLDRLTPLWYYILREAQLRKGGERLGEVGSRIVAETFVGLIKSSRISILPKDTNGRPSRPELAASGKFSMADLLYFVDNELEGENFLNPLGDEN